MISNNKTSHLISSQVPKFVKDDHPTFVEFLESYYKFMEQDDNAINAAKQFTNYLDPDLAAGNTEIILTKLYDNYVMSIPQAVIADKNVILKNVQDFYRARGTEKSIRFLARALYGKEVDVYYPKQDILRASDGKWYVEKSIRVNEVRLSNTIIDDGASKFASHIIRGEESNATATVESVDVYYEKGSIISELKISGASREFVSGENVYTYIEEEGQTKHLAANIFSGIVISASIDVAGNNYIEGTSIPVIPTDGITGSGSRVLVSKTTQGGLRSIVVTYTGAGYQVGQDISIIGGGGIGATGNVFVVDKSGYYHPNSYNIIGSTILSEANTPLNVAFGNQATIFINTSNLLVSTGGSPGSNVSTLTLDQWSGNSNVYFELYDQINVNNRTVTVTSIDYNSDTLSVSPSMGSGLSNRTLIIYKKANVNTSIANASIYWRYSNVGPVTGIAVLTGGENYTSIPSISIRANTIVRSLGILGRMRIDNGGENYQIGDIITFDRPAHPNEYGEGALAEVSNVDINGAITQVSFIELEGFPIGGMGYDKNHPPIANIHSTMGTNAVIVVTETLGEGLQTITSSDTIGSILRLTVQQGGSGYVNPPTLDFTGLGDGTARGNTVIVTGIYTYPGRYINDDGHLSSYNFIQNKNYYQNYSYVLRIDESINKFRQYLNNLTHPIGTKLFGEYMSINQDQLNLKNTVSVLDLSRIVYSSAGYESVGDGSTSIIYINKKSSNLYYPDYTEGDNVYLLFRDGDSANLVNGMFTVTGSNTDAVMVSFANSVNSTGNVYISQGSRL